MKTGHKRSLFLFGCVIGTAMVPSAGSQAQEAAAAQSRFEPWQFAAWQGPSRCAPESRWIEEIRARSGDVTELRALLQETTLQIEAADARFTATLRYRQDVRALSAATCADLLLLTATTVASMVPTVRHAESGTNNTGYRFSGQNLALFQRAETRFESHVDGGPATARGLWRLLCARMPCQVDIPNGAELGAAQTNAETRAQLDMQDLGRISILPVTEMRLVPGGEHALSLHSHQPGLWFSEFARFTFTALTVASAISTGMAYQGGDSVRDFQAPLLVATITFAVAAITTWLVSTLLTPHA